MDDSSAVSHASHDFGLVHLCQYFSDRSPHPMLAVEGETCIVRHVNDAFLKIAGKSREALIGQPFALCVPEREANGCVGLLDRVYHTGIPESIVEQQHGNGKPVYWSYAVWAILGLDELPVGVMIQVSDSTEIALFREQAVRMNESLLVSAIRQQELAEAADEMNARLEEAIKGKEYFIAILSHELRTPLTPVLLASSMMRNDPHIEPRTRGVMEMVHRNITLEARLIDDLLDMTRIENGKLSLDLQRVDLRDVLERAVETSGTELEAANLKLERDLGSSPLTASVDAGRMQQVFSNLFKNAIKFTPPGGRIRISARSDGTSCTIEVSDTGAGIDPGFLPGAFIAFEQDNKSQSHKSGLGLGLAICKTIVNLHGGVITAHSAGKGLGATFSVTLPMVAADPTEELDYDLAVSGERKPLRILLVEDHIDSGEVLSMLLEGDGHYVRWARDIAEARKLASTNEFDLLVSDLGLPDGSGIDLMRALRNEGLTLPGIALTGYGQDNDIERSRAAGFATHLIKPVNQEKLNKSILALVG